MSQQQPTQSEIDLFEGFLDKASGQLHEDTPDSIVECLAIQIQRVGEAKKRINTEGIVVRDLKGSVIQHPAIQIEINAIKQITEIIKKFK